MRVTALDRSHFRLTADDSYSNNRRLVVLIPSFTDQGFDPDTQTGNDPMSGNAIGRAVAWVKYEIYGFTRPVTQMLMTYGQVPPGVEIGDVIFTTRLVNEDVLDKAYGNQYSYIYLDQQTWRPVSTCFSGIGTVDEVSITCKHYTPAVYRCLGY